jgi:integrase
MKAKAARGIYEHPAGSGVWWIHYYADGKRHREKAGRKSDATALYQKRKADARRKLKLPELVPGKVVTFGHLSELAVEHAETHLKSIEHYKTKDSILRAPFGARAAAAITPHEINEWLTKHCKTPATANRYRAFMSLAYQLGMENKKVDSNPARLVRLRPENNERLRFLSRGEYTKLLGIIRRDNPEQAPAFIVSVYTGMRWGEQFSLEWGQVNLKRKVIRLTETKNGSALPPTSTAAAGHNISKLDRVC